MNLTKDAETFPRVSIVKVLVRATRTTTMLAIFIAALSTLSVFVNSNTTLHWEKIYSGFVFGLVTGLIIGLIVALIELVGGPNE